MCKHRRAIAHTAKHHTNIKKKKKNMEDVYKPIWRDLQNLSSRKKRRVQSIHCFLCKKEEMRKHTLSLFIWGKRNIGRINQ